MNTSSAGEEALCRQAAGFQHEVEATAMALHDRPDALQSDARRLAGPAVVQDEAVRNRIADAEAQDAVLAGELDGDGR